MPYYVYMMTNKDDRVLYTGVTNNLQRRIGEHKSHEIKGFTQKYNICKLVYAEEFSDVKDAIAAEKKIKGWTRAKKNALVETVNPDWKDLSAEDNATL